MADDAFDEARFERVLAIGAHPDDAEYFAGGTLARFVDAGAHVALVVCTDGSRGGRGVDEIARVRATEQARAAELLGLRGRANLGRLDGELANDDSLRAELVHALRRQRPELVLAHDPRTLWNTYGGRAHPGHSDHRAAGQAVLDALYPRAASPNFFPEQLAETGVEPWYPREVWLFDTAAPDLHIDVSTVFERKLDALRAHMSQNTGDALLYGARALGQAEPFVRLVLRKEKSVLTGKCLCEGVRFEISGAFGPLGYCHCKQCQRATGSAFSASSTLSRADVRFVAGVDLLREFESSPGRFRVFCSRCGSPVYKRTNDQPDAIRIRLGLVDGDPKLHARVHIHVSTKAPWYEISDALPQLPEGLPPRK